MANYELNKNLYIGDSDTKMDDINTFMNDINTLLQNFYSFKSEYYGAAGTTLNANDFKNSGIYIFDTNITVTNRPTRITNNLDFLVVLRGQYTNGIQIWFNYNSVLYFRIMAWNSWTSWKKITIS